MSRGHRESPQPSDARSRAIRNEFPSTDFVSAGINLHRSTADAIDAPAFQSRRAQTYAELERRLMQAPETVAVTFATTYPRRPTYIVPPENTRTSRSSSIFLERTIFAP